MTKSVLRLVLVGAGQMGGTLLRGWLELKAAPNLTPRLSLHVVDPFPTPILVDLCHQYGCHLNEPPPEKGADVLVLALKPQSFEAMGSQLQPFLTPDSLVLSIMAGKSLETLRRHLPSVQTIIRAMPNTPASVGRGITALFAESPMSVKERHLVETLLAPTGQLEWLSHEAQMDRATAVSGSGPAYVFYLVECLAQAGVAVGLPPDLAMRLARATVEGAGELMAQNPSLPVSVLRQNVTSPGGTTQAALDVLTGSSAANLESLMTAAVTAAVQRAQSLEKL